MNKTIRSSLIVLSVTGCLAGCAQNNPPQPTFTAPVYVTDQEVASTVRHKIDQAKGVHGHKILVSSQNGIIILNGTVRSQHVLELVEDAAASVPGVRAVHSNIVVSN